MSKPIMTVVGFGPMGKRFTRLFSSDISARVSSSRNVGEEVAEIGVTIVADRGHFLASSDYIFLSVRGLSPFLTFFTESDSGCTYGTSITNRISRCMVPCHEDMIEKKS